MISLDSNSPNVNFKNSRINDIIQIAKTQSIIAKALIKSQNINLLI